MEVRLVYYYLLISWNKEVQERMDKTIYLMTLQLYLEEHGIDKNYEESENFFPYEWTTIDNYRLKTDILSEALKKKITVEKTDRFKKYLQMMH